MSTATSPPDPPLRPTRAEPGLLDGAYYLDEDQWRQLPSWTRFFVTLGTHLAGYHSPDGAPVVVVSLPTRAYAAALSATGIVLHRARIAPEQQSIDAHFAYLCTLATTQPDTPVFYREIQGGRARRRQGKLTGLVEVEGEPLLRVQVGGERQGNLRYLVKERDCLKVQLARKPGAVGFVRSLKDQDFLARNLPVDTIAGFDDRSRFECAIIGVVKQLELEIGETTFGYPKGNTVSDTGQLQDLLRVRRFLPASQHYRTEVFPATHEPTSDDLTTDRPAVAVFDGSTGFLKWRDSWRGIPWLVLLDRTDRHAAEAVAAVRSEDMYRVGDADALKIPPIPAGIEVMTFELSA